LNELDFIARLRAIATHPGARGLNDDVAMLTMGRHKLILTHDNMVEGIHFLPQSDPTDIAWKLVATNLSDLAAKGARPMGVLMSICRHKNPEWDAKFTNGLEEALHHFMVPLLGGDTVSMPDSGPCSLGLTAIGESRGHIVPARDGAKPGHLLYVTGTIGDAWAGLQLEKGMLQTHDAVTSAQLLSALHRPHPQLEAGRKLSNIVSAILDVSDGLLLDASRIADASDVQIHMAIEAIPLSDAFRSLDGEIGEMRMKAATGGDDYQLLFTASPETVIGVEATKIGYCETGRGLQIWQGETPVPLPENLGYLHG